jgi:hypothetical protein
LHRNWGKDIVTTKISSGKAKAKQGAQVLELKAAPDDDKGAILAQVTLQPTAQAALTVQSYSFMADAADIPLNALVAELSDQCSKASSGDLSRAEAMLTAQAHTLDAIFGACARRAAANMGEYTQTAELYLRLGLKAQGQCRATLETLATIKNPPVVIARQANVTTGPQQVNNGFPLPSRAGESANAPSKLLEADDGKRLDNGATGTASSDDQTLETVGAVDRTEDNGR